MSELSPGDVLAMTKDNDGLWGGNGSWFIVLILFFLAMGGNFGWGGNNAAAQGALTRAELYEGLSTQDIKNSINGLSNQMNTGFDNTTLAINNGFNGVQYGMMNGFNGVQSSIADSRYAMQDCCCQIKTAIHSEGEETRALIQSNTIQDLRDKVADKDRELLTTGLVAAQTLQTNNIENFIRSLIGGCGCGA